VGLKYEDGLLTSGAAVNNAPTEIAGFTENTFAMLRFNGSSLTNVSSDARDAVANVSTKTAVSQFSPWSMGSNPTNVRVEQFETVNGHASGDATPALVLGSLTLCGVMAGLWLVRRRSRP